MALLEMFLVHAGVFCAERGYHHVSHKMRQSDFLCYDPRYLIECYRDEGRRIGSDLPYTEEVRFLGDTWGEFLDNVERFNVLKLAEPFELANKPPRELSDLQAHALAQFVREGRLDRDEAVVRLESYDPTHKILVVQKCAYTDGLRSNYAIDLKGYLKFGTSDVSLRAVLQAEYGKKLPPLSDHRLSNAIGISAVILYKTDDGDILPYLPLRAKAGVINETIGTTMKQAVFHGGYHCTASGETMWVDGQSSLGEIFTRDICRELNEEVGITEDDLAWIYPVSFCREFLRGGKPQMFFTGLTKLRPNEINSRRRTAIQRQLARGRQEVQDKALFAATPEQLYAKLWSHGSTEAVANMALAHDCAILAHKSGKLR